nr:FKBP12-interacting protein of 37 kDa-like [Tanacetum cinerariifolium]
SHKSRKNCSKCRNWDDLIPSPELEKAKKKEVAFIVTIAKREQEIAYLKVGKKTVT